MHMRLNGRFSLRGASNGATVDAPAAQDARLLAAANASPRDRVVMLRKVGLLVVCLTWLLPGLIGHSPWKPDEAYTIDIIQHFAHSSHWVVPQLAGEPFMEKPPLYDWTAVGVAKVFSHWLPFADAARLTSGFFMALALLFIALTTREVFGRRIGWLAVLALIGTIGLVQPAHEAFTDIGLFAGIAAALYGLVLCLRRPRLGGAWLGTGVGVAFLCKGLIGPGLIGVTALALLCCGRAWRRRRYFEALLIAFACSLPWLLAWPIALYLRSPHLFTQWLWVNNFGRYFGFVYEGGADNRDYYFQVLPAFTWPVLPLAAWTLWSKGRELVTSPRFQVPLLFAVVTFGVLEASAVGSNTYALPLLLPLAILAAGGIDSLPVKAATVADWLAFVTLGLAAMALWIGWVALATGRPTAVAAYLNHFQPDYIARPQTLALAISAVCTAAWLLIAAPRPRAPRHALLSWTAGITLIWVLGMTIWLPWIDTGKSYRGVVNELVSALPRHYNCVESENLRDAQRGMLDYYAGIRTRRLEVDPHARCDLLIIETPAQRQPLASGWQPLWHGSRPGEKLEHFWLFRKEVPAAVRRPQSVRDEPKSRYS